MNWPNLSDSPPVQQEAHGGQISELVDGSLIWLEDLSGLVDLFCMHKVKILKRCRKVSRRMRFFRFIGQGAMNEFCDRVHILYLHAKTRCLRRLKRKPFISPDRVQRRPMPHVNMLARRRRLPWSAPPNLCASIANWWDWGNLYPGQRWGVGDLTGTCQGRCRFHHAPTYQSHASPAKLWPARRISPHQNWRETGEGDLVQTFCKFGFICND